MRLYFDDDSAEALLVSQLRQSGYDVQVPGDVGRIGESDSDHLTHAVRDDCVLLSRHYSDFKSLHNLIMQVQGHYPGLFIVRRDNDARRDLKPAGIVRAIRNFLAMSVPVRNQFTILNRWR
jgi:uncharacterized protein with PIN domain